MDDVNKMNEQMLGGARSAAYKKIGCVSKQGWQGKNKSIWWNEQLSKSKRLGRAKYRLEDFESSWVRSRRGVRQECILSKLLFGLYKEELVERLRNTGMGINVNGKRLSILLYADVAVMMSECGDELQAMLNVVNVYG